MLFDAFQTTSNPKKHSGLTLNRHGVHPPCPDSKLIHCTAVPACVETTAVPRFAKNLIDFLTALLLAGDGCRDAFRALFRPVRLTRFDHDAHDRFGT